VRIRDISRPLDPSVWVWPGDTPFSGELGWKMAEGASVNVGRFTMSCHAGTHMDAPYHFAEDGPRSDAIPLGHCIGACDVLPLARLAESTAERVLVKAEGGVPTAAQLGALGRRLRLFGTDHHSVDPMDSKSLDAHKALWRMGAVILEELDLADVPDGRYELIALPLRLVGMDASPVRAVLVEGVGDDGD
jgi:arylformamidase